VTGSLALHEEGTAKPQPQDGSKFFTLAFRVPFDRPPSSVSFPFEADSDILRAD